MQDLTEAFNHNIVYILIQHIEAYMTKIGIDMGIDDKIQYNITANNGQVNVANDQSSITATLTITNGQIDELTKLINAVKLQAESSLNINDVQEIMDSLAEIKNELQKPEPKRGIIKTLLNGLSAIKGTTEFLAAVASLSQFVLPLIVKAG
jgi:cob(I)alamin adenosyltransferase